MPLKKFGSKYKKGGSFKPRKTVKSPFPPQKSYSKYKPYRTFRRSRYSYTKKFGTKRISEIFDWVSNCSSTGQLAAWKVYTFNFEECVSSMMVGLCNRSNHRYQVRWVKLHLYQNAGKMFYCLFAPTSKQNEVWKTITDRGLIHGSRSIGRRLAVKPRSVFNKYHGTFPEFSPTGVVDAAKGRSMLDVIPGEAQKDATKKLRFGGISLFVLEPAGIAAAATIANNEITARWSDTFDVRITCGFTRITN